MKQKEALERCLALAASQHEKRTGRSVAPAVAMAEICGISRRAVYKWRAIPPERCLRIESALSGEVTRYEMRPDVFGPAPDAAA